MKKAICLPAALLLLVGGCGMKEPAVCRTPEALDPGSCQIKLQDLPDPDESGEYDLRWRDLSGITLHGQEDKLLLGSFDTLTRWPEELPEGFDPGRVLALGKDPGLGVRALHEQGITGRGVGIGVIDQTLLTGHQEYAQRLRYYREYGRMPEWEAQMHGAAVSSIALGKTAGVAPEALLYYIADDSTSQNGDGEEVRDMRARAKDLDRFIELNETLGEDEKIRVVSISAGYLPDSLGAAEMDAAIRRARAAGVAVVWVSDTDPLMNRFYGMGRPPLSDPNDYRSFVPAMFRMERVLEGDTYEGALLIPMDSRTAASPTGNADYVFYRSGGESWTMPYLAGLYALCWQACPGIDFARFTQAAEETARPVSFLKDGKDYPFGSAVDPAAMIKYLTEQK